MPPPRPRRRSPASSGGRRTRQCRKPQRSRIKPLLSPALPRTAIDDTVVQPERPLMPELDRERHDAEARPVRRPRHWPVPISRIDLRNAPLQLRPALQKTRLIGRPGADLAVSRTGSEIGVRLAISHPLGRALDAHLASE